MRARRIFFAILALQLLGAVGCAMNGIAPDWLGRPLWVTGFLALIPGNLAVPPVVERLLWNTGASLRTIAVADLVSSIALNLAIAGALLGVVRSRRVRERA